LTDFKNVRLGDSQVNKVYLGDNLVWNYVEPDIVAPTTTINPDPISTYNIGQSFWFEVDETCNTYYTLDGTTPTVNSTLYVEPFTLDVTTDVKYFSVDLAGNVESVKTTTLTIAGATPVTTISPASTIQNTIPFTVSLSATNNPTAIYYRLGSGTQQTYSAPFSVNQTSAGVQSAYIAVHYWSVNANGTETEKTITYDTTGAIPSTPTPSVINGENQVTLNWSATTNTTSYSVFRSTVQGTTGSVLIPSQYQTATTFTDTTAIGGTTYYYTVRSANYWRVADSTQVTGLPTSSQPSYRYLKIQGYGATESGQETTTRLVEFEAWEGATNRMTSATILSNDAISTGGAIGTIKDTIKTASGYPIWWTATPNANVVIDLGASYPLTKLNYYGYSINGVQRANRFNILASNTNNGSDWVNIWNMQTNTTLQPILPNGYEKIL
jgi:Chitobiase/beta-hexosaminidase C-terminal domain